VLGREEDVRGLDVAMDDALSMGLRHRFDDRHDERSNLVERESAALAHVLREIFAVEELLDDERRPVQVLVDVEHVDDVRMTHDVRDARLTEESLEQIRVLHVLQVQELDRDLAIHVQVGGAVDVAHSTCPEERLDPVLRGEYVAYPPERHPSSLTPRGSTPGPGGAAESAGSSRNRHGHRILLRVSNVVSA